MIVGKPRPAAWFANEAITTPVTAGSMIDVLDVTHEEFAVMARGAFDTRHELRR